MTPREWNKFDLLREKLPELFTGPAERVGMICMGFNMTSSQYAIAPDGHYNYATRSELLYDGSNSHASQCAIQTHTQFLRGAVELVNVQLGAPWISSPGAYAPADAMRVMLELDGPSVYSASFMFEYNSGFQYLIEQAVANNALLFTSTGWGSKEIGVGAPCTPAQLHGTADDFSWLWAIPAIHPDTLQPAARWHGEWCPFAVFAAAPSFANPFAAAVAAAVRKLEPGISNAETMEVLCAGCVNSTEVERYSRYGVLNLYRVIKQIRPNLETLLITMPQPTTAPITEPNEPQDTIDMNTLETPIGSFTTSSPWSTRGNNVGDASDNNPDTYALCLSNTARFEAVDMADIDVAGFEITAGSYGSAVYDKWNPARLILYFADGTSVELGIPNTTAAAVNRVLYPFNARDLTAFELGAINTTSTVGRLTVGEIKVLLAADQGQPDPEEPPVQEPPVEEPPVEEPPSEEKRRVIMFRYSDGEEQYV